MTYLRTAAGIWHGKRAFTGPFFATIDVTHRCNIQCGHCYFFSPSLEKPGYSPTLESVAAEGKNPSTGEIKPSQHPDADFLSIHSLIDELLKMGTRRFSFSGHGEPFLHKDLIDILGHVKSAGAYCTVCTNGTRLDRSTIDELIKMKADELRVTTLAGNQSVYEKTHPGISSLAFDGIKAALNYLAERKQALATPYPRVRLICVVYRDNADHLYDFAKFAAEVKVDSVLYNPVNTDGFKGLSTLVPSRAHYPMIDSQLDEVKPYLLSKGIDTNIDLFRCLYKKESNTLSPYTVIPCYYGWLGVRFDANGDVYPCCRAYKSIGNATVAGFSEIWNSPSYQRFRKAAFQINKRRTSVRGCFCSSCAHRTANMKVYDRLHPIKRRFSNFQGIS